MSVAIEILKAEHEEQSQKLAAVRESNDADIERGRRAQQEVDRQARRVNEIAQAIDDLMKIRHGQEVAA